jgi:hypothetical protein
MAILTSNLLCWPYLYVTTSEIIKKHMGSLLDGLKQNLLISKYWRDFSQAEKQLILDECFDRDTYSIEG